MIITPIFLKSLNIVRLNNLIVFDFPSDQRDIFRYLGKFNKIEESSNTCYFFIDKKDNEKHLQVIENLKAICDLNKNI
jgi:hypothetical protein